MSRWVWCVLVAGCGAATGHVEHPAPHWTDDFFLARTECAPDVEHYGEHVALTCGRRVYASNGDDMATQTVAGLLPLFAGPSAPRVALLGIGSGIELTVLLDGGAQVDLYEPDARLLETAGGLEVSTLRWIGGRPTHPSLTIVTGREDAPDPAPTYDAIVHADAETVLSLPPRVYVRERLERLASHLSPGGVMSAHLQLYEIHATHYQRFVATFASALADTALVAAEWRSTDTLLVGSRSGVVFSRERGEALFARAELGPHLERAGLVEPFDLLALVLLDGADEIRAWSPIARPYTETEPLAVDAWPRRPPGLGDEAPDAAWDEWNARVDAWFYAEGFDDLTATVFDPLWPHGRGCARPTVACPLAGRALGPDESVGVVRGLLRHGRFDLAAEVLETLEPSALVDRLVAILGILVEPPGPIDPFVVLGRTATTPAELALATAWAEAQATDSGWVWIRVMVTGLDSRANDGPARAYLAAYAATRGAADIAAETERDALEPLVSRIPGAAALLAYLASLAGDDLAAYEAAERATAE